MKKTSIGGQALIEGLMLMGPENYTIAVRKPDGEIIVEDKPLPPKKWYSSVPIARGAFGIFRQMVIGVKSLMFSADFVDIEEGGEGYQPSKLDKFIDKIFGDKLKDAVIYFSVILSLAFSVGLFILLPNFVAGLLPFHKNTNFIGFISMGSVIYNLIEGFIRIALFFTYIALVSQLKDMKRVWEYHGAEHKIIHCYENGDELTVENVKKYPTQHPRCGTSFLFTVMVISILIFSLVGIYHPIINILVRLALIPFVAGISLELIKFAGRSDSSFMKIVNAPGLAFQNFTTREPDASQIEVGIAAFNAIKVSQPDGDKW